MTGAAGCGRAVCTGQCEYTNACPADEARYVRPVIFFTADSSHKLHIERLRQLPWAEKPKWWQFWKWGKS